MLSVTAETELGELRLDVALEVAAGECLALAGPSGAGKSSVLRIAAGLLRPRAGRVACGERVWLDRAAGVDLPPEQRRCGYVFQDYALFPNLSAWQNVGYGLPRRGRRERALELLERFGLADRADARPRTLSGGERQRVALARALAVGAGRAAARRAAVGARRAHAGGGRARAGRRAARGRRARAAGDARLPGGGAARRPRGGDGRRPDRPDRLGERAGGRAGVAVRGRLHRRRRAHRHRLAGRRRAHAGRARRRGRGELARTPATGRWR